MFNKLIDVLHTEIILIIWSVFMIMDIEKCIPQNGTSACTYHHNFISRWSTTTCEPTTQQQNNLINMNRSSLVATSLWDLQQWISCKQHRDSALFAAFATRIHSQRIIVRTTYALFETFQLSIYTQLYIG